jgi:hypothetical protein
MFAPFDWHNQWHLVCHACAGAASNLNYSGIHLAEAQLRQILSFAGSPSRCTP